MLAAFSSAAFFYVAVTQAAYPYELGYAEGIVLWQAQHVTNLASAYAPLSHLPYVVFHYTPLYHLVSLGASKITGDLLHAGRLVSLISTLGICLTLAWTVYRSLLSRVSPTAAIGGAVVAFAAPCGLEAVIRFAPLMRMDMLGLWFVFGGLAVFVLATNTRSQYAAMLLFLAALYTRQTLIAGALSCLLVAAIVNLRQAAKLIIFTFVLGATILAALTVPTHGQVLKHLFLYNLNRYAIQWAVGPISMNVESTVPLLSMAIAAAIGPFRDVLNSAFHKRLARLRLRMSSSAYNLALFTFTIHFIIAGLTVLGVGKSGADVNYFLEWNLSACVLAGLLLGGLLRPRHLNRVPSALVLAYVLPLLMLLQQSLSGARLLAHSSNNQKIMEQYARDSQALENILRDHSDPVMSEDMTLLYKAGKPVPFEPAIVAELTERGIWDEAPLVTLIRNQTFSVMVISDPHSLRYSPGVGRAILENYQPVARYSSYTLGSSGAFTVYVPQSCSRMP